MEKEGGKQETVAAAGFKGHLHAVLWFAEEGHGGAVTDSSIVRGQGTFTHSQMI